MANESAIAVVEAALKNGMGLAAEFCNDPEGNEWHAMTYGFTAGWMADDPALKFDVNLIPVWYPQAVRDAILGEYHYYNWGWTIGWTADSALERLGGFLKEHALKVGAGLALIIAGYAKTKGWL